MQSKVLDEGNRIFKSLLRSDSALLHHYQEKVIEYLLFSGKNIILRAPTGAGKTWAALLPYLLSRKFDLPFVDKVLYALPLRSLASQLFNTTVESCKRAAADLCISINNGNSNNLAISIQTGEQQDDPYLQGDIVFTTIDQLLSSYLLDPVSLPGRLANINAGALLGSLVVFDEFHLLDPNRSMGTAIEMLDRLNGLCRFVLMTATLSDEAVSFLDKYLNSTVVLDLSKDEIGAIEKKKEAPTRRVWRYHDDPITAEGILGTNHSGRTLVLTNTVSRAQQIYREINDLIGVRKDGPEVVLLHSRFFPRDRGNKEALINDRLQKQNQQEDANFILVSTQVVEAGMDFSVDKLHSELAPVNSLIQRAGRCARYGGKGTVNIYSVENNSPYSTGMAETAAYMASRNGACFSYADEREAVNQVLGEHEKNILAQYGNMTHRRSRVNLSIDGLFPGARHELIRDINSISVILTADPEKIIFDNTGGAPEMLSVPFGTLLKFLNQATQTAGKQWVVKHPFPGDSCNNENRVMRFLWEKVEPKSLHASWLVALNPAFANYSNEMGLLLGETGEDIAVVYNKQSKKAGYCYQCETYAEHVKLVLKQNSHLINRSLKALSMLSGKLRVNIKDIEKAAFYALMFHDVGKLSRRWQEAAIKWQAYKNPASSTKGPFAHTDYNPELDWEKQRAFPGRPNHAVEGAYAVFDYLVNVFGNVEMASCICTAIARHHSGHGSKLCNFNFIPGAVEEINRLHREAALPLLDKLRDKPDQVNCGPQGFAYDLLQAGREEDRPWLPLYFFLVRQLRLADQAGSAEGGRS